jgi:hypothetical protein
MKNEKVAWWAHFPLVGNSIKNNALAAIRAEVGVGNRSETKNNPTILSAVRAGATTAEIQAAISQGQDDLQENQLPYTELPI